MNALAYHESRVRNHADPLRSTPVLALIASDPEWMQQRPFKGKRVLMLLHALSNLVAFVVAAMRCGLDPANTTVFFKDYDYGTGPQKQLVLDDLAARGLDCRPVSEAGAPFFDELLPGLEKSGLPLLIIEDGGHLTPRILRNPELASRTHGAVEQTTRGVRAIEEAQAELGAPGTFPIVSLPASRLKQQFEPPHIADATIRAIQASLDGRCLNQMRVTILGVGAIGRPLIQSLALRGVKTTFHDRDPLVRLVSKCLPATMAETPISAVREADLVIGASGRTSITPDVIQALPHGCWIASASSEQIEVDRSYIERIASESEPICLHGEGTPVGTRYTLRPTGKVVYLLADGRPINFSGRGGMSDQSADLIMSLILIASLEVAAGHLAGQNGLINVVDELAVKHELCERYLRFWP